MYFIFMFILDHVAAIEETKIILENTSPTRVTMDFCTVGHWTAHLHAYSLLTAYLHAYMIYEIAVCHDVR